MTKVILQPAASPDARQHFADTMDPGVTLARIRPFLSSDDVATLELRYGSQPTPTWGVTPGAEGENIATWDRTVEGDVAFFSGDWKLYASGVVTHKVRSAALGREFWGEDASGRTWELLYFLELNTTS